MSVVTIVEGKIPSFKMAEFEAAYASTKKEPLPPGLMMSSLLKNSKTPEIYRIQTVWQSHEALEKMRSSTNTPKAIELFQKVGATPNLEVYYIVDNLP